MSKDIVNINKTLAILSRTRPTIRDDKYRELYAQDVQAFEVYEADLKKHQHKIDCVMEYFKELERETKVVTGQRIVYELTGE